MENGYVYFLYWIILYYNKQQIMSEEESFKKKAISDRRKNDNKKLGLFSEQNIKPAKSSCWFRDTDIVERPNLLTKQQSMPTGEQHSPNSFSMGGKFVTISVGPPHFSVVSFSRQMNDLYKWNIVGKGN